jgi:hypothetical protein
MVADMAAGRAVDRVAGMVAGMAVRKVVEPLQHWQVLYKVVLYLSTTVFSSSPPFI